MFLPLSPLHLFPEMPFGKGFEGEGSTGLPKRRSVRAPARTQAAVSY